ncbi:MAG: YgaP family membrane protein [Gemmatimonadaceae bacterium]
MCNDNIIRRFAGVFILASLALGWFLSPAWFLFTAFVGMNLLQSSFSNFCPLERILGHFGVVGCERKPEITNVDG